MNNHYLLGANFWGDCQVIQSHQLSKVIETSLIESTEYLIECGVSNPQMSSRAALPKISADRSTQEAILVRSFVRVLGGRAKPRTQKRCNLNERMIFSHINAVNGRGFVPRFWAEASTKGNFRQRVRSTLSFRDSDFRKGLNEDAS